MKQHKMEEWREISGFPNYQISSLGRVKSLKYKRTNQEGIKSEVTLPDGYKVVGLWSSGVYLQVKIHKLVALAFLEREEGKEEIHHINHNRGDNRVENLRWVTKSENCLDRVKKTNTGEEMITKDKRWNSYKVQIKNKDTRIVKSFKTLQEAINWRDFKLSSVYS